ncbi:MAG: acyl-CoA dehydrogenase C-terminal domain-containing protein [Desulfobacterales bacterium]|nr:acyl-CoA dehydrogenase C-terminal domain-containing protein [Desulfobacterales bacterium]
MAWQWLLQATVAQKALAGNPLSVILISPGKASHLCYFFNYELPKIEGLARRLQNSDGLTIAMKSEYLINNPKDVFNENG